MLLGPDHTELDEVAVATIASDTAIALTRGRHRKGYPHLDPNEDGVLAARAPAGVLLAVADGHAGFDAAGAALRAVSAAAGTVLHTAAASLDTALTEAFRLAAGAVAVAIATARPERARSRTALTVAIARQDAAIIGTVGDTTALVIGHKRPRRAEDSATFLGGSNITPRVTSLRLRPGERVILMSDGITDFLGRDWVGAVASVAQDEHQPSALVRELCRLAGSGGAGDNGAVAAWMPMEMNGVRGRSAR